jgi:hypothetical protein
VEPAGPNAAELRAALTPAAAAALGPDGRFAPADVPATGRAQVGAARAESLAVGLARGNLVLARAQHERERGAPIPFDRLAACGPTRYAEAPLARLPNDVPDTNAHPSQKAAGPWWLVTLCDPAGDPAFAVAVSAYSTDLGLDAAGRVVFPPFGGNDFVPTALTRGASRAAPWGLPGPEAAAVLAARVSGRRVAAAPVLVAPYYREAPDAPGALGGASPLGARWRVALDGSARVRTADGRVLEVRKVFVGARPPVGAGGITSSAAYFAAAGVVTWAAEPAQPAAVPVTWVPLPRTGELFTDYEARRAAETRDLLVPRLEGMPVTFARGAVEPAAP